MISNLKCSNRQDVDIYLLYRPFVRNSLSIETVTADFSCLHAPPALRPGLIEETHAPGSRPPHVHGTLDQSRAQLHLRQGSVGRAWFPTYNTVDNVSRVTTWA